MLFIFVVCGSVVRSRSVSFRLIFRWVIPKRKNNIFYFIIWSKGWGRTSHVAARSPLRLQSVRTSGHAIAVYTTLDFTWADKKTSTSNSNKLFRILAKHYGTNTGSRRDVRRKSDTAAATFVEKSPSVKPGGTDALYY